MKRNIQFSFSIFILPTKSNYYLFVRCQNILPYDHNRVKLIKPISEVDYINASWITTANPSKTDLTPQNSSSSTATFIASQGPLLNTCTHHLQMIHEQKIDLVIMLAQLEEGGGKTYIERILITEKSSFLRSPKLSRNLEVRNTQLLKKIHELFCSWAPKDFNTKQILIFF